MQTNKPDPTTKANKQSEERNQKQRTVEKKSENEHCKNGDGRPCLPLLFIHMCSYTFVMAMMRNGEKINENYPEYLNRHGDTYSTTNIETAPGTRTKMGTFGNFFFFSHWRAKC